jgi:UDP-3-O-[3-hydroxymyristoyl] glucosamine N-acyltransferase
MRRALNPPLTLGEIVGRLGGELRGDATVRIERLTTLRSADDRSISFLARPQQRDAALASRAAAFIVSDALAQDLADKPNLVVTPDPYLYYARLAEVVAQRIRPAPPPGIAPG